MAIPKMKIQMGRIRGLNQSLDDNLLNMSYSADCQNMDVSEGILSTRKGSSPLMGTDIDPEFVDIGKIKTILKFSRTSQDVYIVGTISGITERWYSRNSTGWDLITTDGTTPATAIKPGDVRSIMCEISGEAVLIMVSPGAAPQKINILEDNTMRMTALGGTPQIASDITFHRDRVWIVESNAASIPTNTVHYSNAFDPEDWTTAGDTGEVKVMSGDNDYIIGIANLLDDVVIFKRNTMWKVIGDVPSEYQLQQIYAVQGTPHKESICTDGNYCFFAGTDGIYQYDGTTATPILTDEIKDIYAGIKNVKCLLNNSKLYIWDKYVSTSAGKHIIYDIAKKQIEVLYIPNVLDANLTGDIVVYSSDYIIGYTALTCLFCKLDDTKTVLNAGLTDSSGGIPAINLEQTITAYWVTPETDFNMPNASKTLTDIYFIGWGTTSAGAAGGQVKITVYYNQNGTQKTKEKTVTLQTTRKVHDIQLNVSGRLFKFKIENVAGSAINLSDIEFINEVDED